MAKADYIYERDPYLLPFREAIEARHARIISAKKLLPARKVKFLMLSTTICTMVSTKSMVTGYLENGLQMPTEYM